MQISVYHNVATDQHDRPIGVINGYQPKHPVALVAQYDDTVSDTEVRACEWAYFLFNRGDLPEYDNPVALSYRQRGNRSLSVGDVVNVDGRWFACVSFGWREFTHPPIRVGTLWGTNPIAERESLLASLG